MPTKPKKNGRRNISWEQIKADYVTDPGLSLKKLSEKYGVPLRTIAEHSKAGSWFATKQEHQLQYCNELATNLHQNKLNQLEQELKAVSNISDRLINVLTNDPDQFNRHIMQLEYPVETENGKVGIRKEPVEEIFEKIDTRAVKDIVQSLKLIEDMKRSIIGIQRIENIQKHQLDADRMQLERERFELEKQKAAFRNGETEDASKYGVVLMPEVLTDGE